MFEMQATHVWQISSFFEGGGVVKSKNSQIPVSIIKQITMLFSPFKIDFKVAAWLSSN